MSDNNSNNKNNPVQPNQKTMWFSIAGVIVLVALIIITPKLRNAPAAPAAPLQIEEPKTEVVDTTARDGGLNGPSYLEALEKYEATRVVFAADCKATPVTQTFPVGTTVMLDNQSAVAHTVTVGEKIYQIGAYKYRTTNLPLIGPVAVHCDAEKDVAAFIVTSRKAQ